MSKSRTIMISMSMSESSMIKLKVNDKYVLKVIMISMSQSSMIQLKVNDKDWEEAAPPNMWAEHLSLSPGQALSIQNWQTTIFNLSMIVKMNIRLSRRVEEC